MEENWGYFKSISLPLSECGIKLTLSLLLTNSDKSENIVQHLFEVESSKDFREPISIPETKRRAILQIIGASLRTD